MEKEKVFKTLVDVAKVAIPMGIVMSGTVFAFSGGVRQKILERDHYRCRVCGATDHLEAAHYNHNKDRNGYNVPSNGRTLCTNCHLMDHIKNAGHNGLSKKANDWAIQELRKKIRSF